MSSAPIICSNPDCNIAVDRKCIEGLDEETCPNFGRAPKPLEETAEATTPPAPTHHELSPSTVIEPAVASRILAAHPSRVVAVIATYDAGKTSLIAALYDAFQRGPVSGLAFAGSSTLLSFELACHDSRSASRRQEAIIARTPIGAAHYYHLDLCPVVGGRLESLLVADRAGEEYMAVAGNVSSVKTLFEVRRADTLTLLVDGVRLADSKQRHNVRAEIEGIVQGLQDGDALNNRQRLAIALTKNDAVQGSDRAAVAIADFERLIESIRKAFGPRFSDIASFMTAASPKIANGQRGQGLPELLAYWMKPPVTPAEKPIKLATTRDFERLKEVEA